MVESMSDTVLPAFRGRRLVLIRHLRLVFMLLTLARRQCMHWRSIEDWQVGTPAIALELKCSWIAVPESIAVVETERSWVDHQAFGRALLPLCLTQLTVPRIRLCLRVAKKLTTYRGVEVLDEQDPPLSGWYAAGARAVVPLAINKFAAGGKATGRLRQAIWVVGGRRSESLPWTRRISMRSMRLRQRLPILQYSLSQAHLSLRSRARVRASDMPTPSMTTPGMSSFRYCASLSYGSIRRKAARLLCATLAATRDGST